MAYTDEYVERVLRESLCLHHNLEAKDAEIARLRKVADEWEEIAEARAQLLTCYRLGHFAKADRALTRIERAQMRLRKLDAGGEGCKA